MDYDWCILRSTEPEFNKKKKKRRKKDSTQYVKCARQGLLLVRRLNRIGVFSVLLFQKNTTSTTKYVKCAD